MTHRESLTAAVLSVAVLSASAPRTAAAQSHIYFTGGIGAGTFTPTCDTGCFGNAMKSNSVILMLGLHATPRIRAEVGVQYQPATGVRSHAGSLSVGVAAYLVRNLFVRGGVSRLDVSVEDSVGVTEGKGGPGFTVGAGYDFPLGETWAITPYVDYFAGSLQHLDYTAGPTTAQTAGRLTALNFGVALSHRAWRVR